MSERMRCKVLVYLADWVRFFNCRELALLRQIVEMHEARLREERA